MNLLSIEWGLKGLSELENIHPLFVHFPIALLLTSFAAYLLGSIFKKDHLLSVGKWLLYFGTIAAAVTVWTGLQAEKTVVHGGGVHETLLVHKNFGFVVLGLSIVLSLWAVISKANMPTKGRWVFLSGLALLALIIIQGADLGGRMVFLHGVGVGKKSEMMESAPHAHDHHMQEIEEVADEIVDMPENMDHKPPSQETADHHEDHDHHH